MTLPTTLVVTGMVIASMAIARFLYAYIFNLPFLGTLIRRLIYRIRIRFRIHQYLRRHPTRRSLKAHELIAGFKGMTGLDGLPRASTQCRS